MGERVLHLWVPEIYPVTHPARLFRCYLEHSPMPSFHCRIASPPTGIIAFGTVQQKAFFEFFTSMILIPDMHVTGKAGGKHSFEVIHNNKTYTPPFT